ncbi:glycoside hydrolase family 26 protein [Kribbella italica]|uniref:Mannan endo-1,4-beta-mannosidase n=1 Tax=Kribbella italica TaxID=1540520 RepID=A0A7W9J5H3_9ACTN|nr:glycosyl hydrolase [Kribbella italica]MBB5835760.1 mannan endo-1,4-beta-mannosidase [Kribbella italica]
MTTPRTPVTPGASPAAQELLTYLYEISGRRTLTGQHNTPRELSAYSEQVTEITGRTAAVWGQDFGFSEDGDMDGIEFRPQIVREAIRQHAAGRVITLMWHAVRPTSEEPVTFKGDICRGALEQTDWDALFVESSEVHGRWIRQVDVIAALLAELRDAGVPVLWRPYHELNGDWFWWCGRPGPGGHARLYRMMFERFTQVHQLTNLVWVWNASPPNSDNVQPYADFYPGHDVVDVLATDVYNNGYGQDHYEELLTVADGRPVALGEVGVMPTPELLEAQPQWVWFMTWTNFLTNANTPEAVRELYAGARTRTEPRSAM